MSWNVLITASPFADSLGKGARDLLAAPDFSITHAPRYGPLSEAEILPLLDGMDAVYASMDKYTDAVLASPQASRLKVISRWGVGCDAIDRAAAGYPPAVSGRLLSIRGHQARPVARRAAAVADLFA